jgi:1-deoxy-D-xylulose-5-phosphate synthase
MYDIAYLRCIPNIVIMAPKDEAELQRMMVTGINYTESAIAMRYPRGSGYGVPLMEEGWEPIPIGKGEVLRHGDDVLLVGYGSMVNPAMQTAEIFSEHGVEATVVNARFAKPLDTELILPLAEQHRQSCHPGRRLHYGWIRLSGGRSHPRCSGVGLGAAPRGARYSGRSRPAR